MQVINRFASVVGTIILCVSPGSAKEVSAQKSAWTGFLLQLNSDLDPSPQNKVNIDLLKFYKEELISITAEWVKQNNDKASKTYSEKKNVFFMNSVEQKNKDEFLGLQKSAVVASADIDEAFMQSVLDDATAYRFFDQTKTVATTAEIAIGFCFYKALMVHYFLLQRGVAQKHIKKIFAVGPLVYQPLVWKFHVAVAVQSKGKTWVIDPLVKKLSTVEDWQKELQKYSAENPYPRLRFYATDPQKFLPNSKEYTWQLIDHKKTKKYNPGFLSYLKKKGQPRN